MQITNMHCSGQTVSLAAGDYHATIVTVGAGLAELTFQGCHLVIPHKPEEMPLAHLGKVLIPWPNRIANGCYRYQGQEYQLPINEHGSKAAIHGLLAWRDWQISELTTTSASSMEWVTNSRVKRTSSQSSSNSSCILRRAYEAREGFVKV